MFSPLVEQLSFVSRSLSVSLFDGILRFGITFLRFCNLFSDSVVIEFDTFSSPVLFSFCSQLTSNGDGDSSVVEISFFVLAGLELDSLGPTLSLLESFLPEDNVSSFTSFSILFLLTDPSNFFAGPFSEMLDVFFSILIFSSIFFCSGVLDDFRSCFSGVAEASGVFTLDSFVSCSFCPVSGGFKALLLLLLDRADELFFKLTFGLILLDNLVP